MDRSSAAQTQGTGVGPEPHTLGTRGLTAGAEHVKSAASPSFRERFEQSHSPRDYLNWLNDYVNRTGRRDDELHALCSWAYSVIADLENELADADGTLKAINEGIGPVGK